MMNSTSLTLAYSPCPNDTFIFYAMAHQQIDCQHLAFDITLADVETLNQAAKTGIYDISKLSFSALGHLQETYGLLRSGAALGRGCGPLIVARPDTGMSNIRSKKIAVPGLCTTAYMLLSLYLSEPPNVTAMPFDQIMSAVANGAYDFGVIIHEGRFTYENYGLTSLLDLGEWWESETGLPIPLGGIAIRRDIPQEIARTVETLVRESAAYALRYKSEPAHYIQSHSQEMAMDVIQQHISLYVNEFTLELGTEGEAAVHALFDRAVTCGILRPAKGSLLAVGC